MEVGFLPGAVIEDDVVVEWVEVPIGLVGVSHGTGEKGLAPFSLLVARTVLAGT